MKARFALLLAVLLAGLLSACDGGRPGVYPKHFERSHEVCVPHNGLARITTTWSNEQRAPYAPPTRFGASVVCRNGTTIQWELDTR